MDVDVADMEERKNIQYLNSQLRERGCPSNDRINRPWLGSWEYGSLPVVFSIEYATKVRHILTRPNDRRADRVGLSVKVAGSVGRFCPCAYSGMNQ